ncbi:MAG: hypothetical protein H7A47_03575 [Verrucomicrobiales bacterium]|nr:hypothetical protein [Verrucomicrobiales bacterium]
MTKRKRESKSGLEQRPMLQARGGPARGREVAGRPGGAGHSSRRRGRADIGMLAAILLSVGQCFLAPGSLAQALPLEFRSTEVRPNLQSLGGVPLSGTVADPAGSNGLAPSPAGGLAGTSGQFQTLLGFSSGSAREFDLELVSFQDPSDLPTEGVRLVVVGKDSTGGELRFRVFDGHGQMILDEAENEISNRSDELAALRGMLAPLLGQGLSSGQRASILNAVAAITDGRVGAKWDATGRAGRVFLTRARLGNPFLNRSFTHRFGDIIARPTTDEYGVDLVLENAAINRPANVLAADYWYREPYTEDGHADAGYYWSIHAERVYATEPGPVTVVWRKVQPRASGGNSGANPPDVGVATIGTSDYTVYTNRYSVSSEPAKRPRKMYWTEGQFQQVGKPVTIPTERVRDVNIVYNRRFPELTPLVDAGFELRLLSITSAAELPGAGAKLVVVADEATSDTLHFRVFDSESRLVVDRTEDAFPGTEAETEDLKAIWNSIPDLETVTANQEDEILDAVSSITGYALNTRRVEWPFDGTSSGPIAITNTLWFDRTLNTIRAYNYQGRAFVELLGDKKGTLGGRDVHDQLGYELVEVVQRPTAEDRTVELGELLTPFDGDPPPGTPELSPDPLLTVGQSFAFRHSVAGTGRFDYYAVRETKHLNDFQMHWLEEGVQGLLWPYRYVRYAMVWPTEASRYTHYVRPLVATEEEARATAVPLPAASAPQIAYQDPLDEPRGKLTESFAYYSVLNERYPAHRALLQFTSGEYIRFERVFSWLDDALRGGNGAGFARSVAASLGAWNGSDGFVWTNKFVSPRVVTQTVYVGQRITAPDGELGGGLDPDYLAGYIQSSQGDSYHPTAYIDPFADGFELANQGAIIPVNAVPNQNQLEVWWFRKNAVDISQGFEASYWPAVIGRYTILWPTGGSEIILASNDGSGPLPSLEATGSIYYENDRNNPGYNPNEEHALMQGGQVYALRDDLNITAHDVTTYSSHPYVLLEYTAPDGRPAIRTFRVRREKPEAGITFEYARPAGSILQAPMPLPLMGAAFAPKIPGQSSKSLNQEVVSWLVSSSRINPVDVILVSATDLEDIPDTGSELVVVAQVSSDSSKLHFRVFDAEGQIILEGAESDFPEKSSSIESLKQYLNTAGLWEIEELSDEQVARIVAEVTSITGQPSATWTLTTEGAHAFRPFWPLALQDGRTTTQWFYPTRVTHDALTGVASTNRPIPMLPLPDGVEPAGVPTRWRFGVAPDAAAKLPLGPALLALPSQGKGWSVIVTNLIAEGNGASSYVILDFGRPRPEEATANAVEAGAVLVPSRTELADNHFDQWMLSWNELLVDGGNFDREELYRSATVTDRKGNLWVYRGPHFPGREESFTLRFYYNTLPGFFFPSLPLGQQPPAGTATPYLRHFNVSTGQFVGDAVYGNRNGDQFADDNALGIIYHPVWPEDAPVLQMAETLTNPKRGLPAVRGQSSAEVLYQQSLVASDGTIDGTRPSVVLHDPTREKVVEFDRANLPDSINSETSRGKIFFPNLPPHLVKRFWLDPNRGESGALVFTGEFIDAALGDDYLFVNVAGPNDTATLKNLCVAGDPQEQAWDTAIDRLATVLEQFVENPGRPGTFIPRPLNSPEEVDDATADLGEVAEVRDDDVAVDSYALTAVGPGTGYVSLIVGNGEAFTPTDDPVSVHVLRVAPELYRGELKVIAPENPLSEKLTLQQVVDLRGRTNGYAFEWRISAPVDGQPPATYTKLIQEAFSVANPWSHVRFPLATDGAAGVGTLDAGRVAQDITNPGTGRYSIRAVSQIPFASVTEAGAVEFRVRFAHEARLLSVSQPQDLPASGENLVVVGRYPTGALHFRVFSPDGQLVFDKPETEVVDRSEEIETFKAQLAGFDLLLTSVAGLSEVPDAGEGLVVVARDLSDRFDLSLVSVSGLSEMPASGNGLVVIGRDISNDTLHFKVFDQEGEAVVDKSAVDFHDRTTEINELAGRLVSLWGQDPIPEDQQDAVLDAVASITGRTLTTDALHFRVFDRSGVAVVSGSEAGFPDKSEESASLRSALALLWDEELLTEDEQDAVLVAVAAITGEARLDSLWNQESLSDAEETEVRDGVRAIAGESLVPEVTPHCLTIGNQLVMSSSNGAQMNVTVGSVAASGASVNVSVDPDQAVRLIAEQVFRLSERGLADVPTSIAFTHFDAPPAGELAELWMGLDLPPGLGAKFYVNGGLVAASGLGAEDTASDSPDPALASPRLARYFKLPLTELAGAVDSGGGLKRSRLAVEFFTSAVPDAALEFKVRIEGFVASDLVTAPGTPWLVLDSGHDGLRAVLGETADVRSLTDNYLTMRYAQVSADGNPIAWSQWTEPQLAEGWIKRVLAGINPFNQRLTDLFENSVSTDVSLITQAGPRWEGDIALNLDSINDYGLIEIYETVLNRGRNLSIDGNINYGPANDALLLAAGYLNDLYMMLGNEAAVDAANPTIGIGTADSTYGDIATALFSFKGQLPSLLEEELSMLRGRDDFLVPGVETRPVYNRMVWNYTRGIDAGEVVYALNYNILDQNTDGRVDAADAQRLYPQGHGDAYGHYLTALKGYYHLFLNPNFDWVPRSEAVLVLGKPVTVDYQDERKLAAAAGALARTGKQVFDLTWRKEYRAGAGNGWRHFRGTRSSNKRTRSWGLDHWASRTAQGAYFNWIVGNAIVPETDPDPAHQDTIQQVDRTTIPELKELPAVVESLQVAMDNAESGLTPLGLPETTVPFDLNPNVVVGSENQTHFEQIYARAIQALDNAVTAFDDAKDVTRLMRSEEDSLADLRAAVDKQELAYTNALIELFGTPYPEDIGPGRTYRTGYAGPDLVHFTYIDVVERNFNGLLDPAADVTFKIDTQTFTADWLDGTNGVSSFFNFIQPARNGAVDGTPALEAWENDHTLWVEFNLSSHGFFEKPVTWTGRRASPGKIQQAISEIVKARNAAFTAFYWADAAKYDLDWAIQSLDWKVNSHETIRAVQAHLLQLKEATEAAKLAHSTADYAFNLAANDVREAQKTLSEAIPKSLIFGFSNGGDVTFAARATTKLSGDLAQNVISIARYAAFAVQQALEYASEKAARLDEFNKIAPEEWNQELRDATSELRDAVYGMNNHFMTINARLQELDDAQRRYRTLLAEGDRIQQEREIYRERTAAIIQGYRTRDAAFRIFRNEKLERYKTLFDLAAQYAYMAAKAYDYETGLLGTAQGREFIQRIVNARALGVVQDGEPQFAGSNTGDPGLSSVLAEMHADWDVVKGRLGFNNPDAYGTTVSLRHENFRIRTTDVGDPIWQNVLHEARRDNLLDDPDVRRYCLQLDGGNGLPVPGFVFEFSTAIADGLNLFGRPIGGGDSRFPVSSFATKIFAAGVALEGYVGMADPAANAGVTGQAGNGPDITFLDPDALAATPYLYLVPVGVDSMRSPPLGDASEVRTWNVDDVAVPLPFNIGGSDFSTTTLWQSADSLSEELFAIRKHQAFRPVSSANVFSPGIYTSSGGLQRSQFTNNRLIGRSVWNSKWKLVIPGKELLANPNEGIERFLRTVRDIKLHFVTYSYAGN